MKKRVLGLLLASQTALAINLPYDAVIREKAGKYGMDPLLIHAQVQQESGHNPRACSGAGACGLMQLMPTTAASLGVTNVYDPVQNVDGGVRYMRSMLAMFGNNIIHAWRAYNWGPGNMRAYLKGIKTRMPQEAADYPNKITRYYLSYGGKSSQVGNVAANPNPSSPTSAPVKVNPNTAKVRQKLDLQVSCPPVKLPEFEKADTSQGSLPVPSPIDIGGIGRPVFDISKQTQMTAQIQQMVRQLGVLRGQYENMVKAAAGLDLLKSITQLAGYELPVSIGKSGGVQGFGDQTESVYAGLKEERAAETGVYESKSLNAQDNQKAFLANHSYAQAEMAWSQINCSQRNLQTLAAVQTQTWKQAKDVGNRIAIERAMIDASQAKIQASIAMMQGAVGAGDSNGTQMTQAFNR